MPDDVSCPDRDEAVTRRILAEELAKFHVELRGELAQHTRAIQESVRADLRAVMEPFNHLPAVTSDHRPSHETHQARLGKAHTQDAAAAQVEARGRANLFRGSSNGGSASNRDRRTSEPA